jgi:hypothetical protein
MAAAHIPKRRDPVSHAASLRSTVEVMVHEGLYDNFDGAPWADALLSHARIFRHKALGTPRRIGDVCRVCMTKRIEGKAELNNWISVTRTLGWCFGRIPFPNDVYAAIDWL